MDHEGVGESSLLQPEYPWPRSRPAAVSVGETPAPGGHPNLLLIVVDTLRGDRVHDFDGDLLVDHVARPADDGVAFPR